MRHVYKYNNDGVYTGCIKQDVDVLASKKAKKNVYPELLNATDKQPPKFDSTLEDAIFKNGKWGVVDKVIEAKVFLKTDGSQHDTYIAKDADKYTDVEPLEAYEDGTKQAFIDGAWIYAKKGKDLLEVIRVAELDKLKALKLQELDAAFKDSKSVVIKNGHSLTITADDADRDYFVKNIEDSINSVHLKENFLEVLEYRQFTLTKVFRVRAVAYLWRYVFGEYNKHRVANKLMYKTFKVAINNASTQEILDGITFKFADALVVNINDKVAEIEADKNTPEGVLKAINDAKDNKGVVHLVKDLTA